MSGKRIDSLLDNLFGDDSGDTSEHRLRDLEGELGVVGGPRTPTPARPKLDDQVTERPTASNAGRRRPPPPPPEVDSSPPRIGAPPPAPEPEPKPEPPRRPAPRPAPASRPASTQPVRPSRATTERPSRPSSTPPRRTTGAHRAFSAEGDGRARRRTSNRPRAFDSGEAPSRRVSNRPRRETASRRALIPNRADTRPARVERPSMAPPTLVDSDDLFASLGDELAFDAADLLAPEPTPGLLGNTSRVARLLTDMHAIDWSSIDPRAGFLITQIDGSTTFDELIILTGLPQADASALLEGLIQQGILG